MTRPQPSRLMTVRQHEVRAGLDGAANSRELPVEGGSRGIVAISPRAVLARRSLVGAALLGVLADPLLRNEPWGLGLGVWVAALAVVIAVTARHAERRLSFESQGWLAVAVLMAAALAWRDSALVLVFDVFAMLAALVLLAMSMNGVPVASLAVARVRDLVRAAFGTGLDVAFGAIPMVLNDAQLNVGRHTASHSNARRTVRAVVIALPIFVVFTFLLTRADPVFGSFFTFPEFAIDELLSHVVIAGFFAWVVAGWMRRSFLATPTADRGELPLPFSLGSTDIAFALGGLLVLFGAFVLVQVGWLFGGEALVVRTTGLTYAEYARRGFFELAFVAGLLLPLLLAAQALIPSDEDETHRLFRRLALPLVVLLGAIMFSAFARMKLYVDYYGISADRLYATAFMSWLAIVFEWFALTVLRSRPRLFAAGVVASGFAVLLMLNVMNPDALVARSNLARGEGGRTGAAGSDVRYVASLGGDAVPYLVESLLAADSAIDAADRCNAAHALLTRWSGDQAARRTRAWTQWNLGRARAMDAVAARRPELSALACAPTSGAASR